MIVLVAMTMLWSAFALNFAKSSFEVPPTVMRALEPVQHWLVSADIEAVQLTNNSLDPEEQLNSAKSGQITTPRSNSTNNFIVIQIIDKLLFVIFLILLVALHN